MAIKPEQLKPKILELRFKPEGYVSAGDEEYRDQLFSMLTAQGIDPDNCVYRGFDGNKVDPVDGLPKDPAVYAMNPAGWDNAIMGKDDTPADYAFKNDNEKPCLAIYHKNQLAEVYSARHLNPEDDDMTVKQIILGEIVKGEELSTMQAGRVVNETVIHKNYPDSPDASPTDALVALVYLDEY